MRQSAGDQSLNSGASAAIACRRTGVDRRKRVIWSLIYGSVQHRRRKARRSEDTAKFIADWYAPSLMYVVVAILLLSATDALLTLKLLQIGAYEANVFMLGLVHGDLTTFAATKMALTGLGVTSLVIRNKVLLFGRVQVSYVLYVVLACYIVVIAYELMMLASNSRLL